MKKRAIIVDLDGTLADITERRRFLEGGRKDWKSFNATIRTDRVNAWCREIMGHMAPTYHLLIVSGRTDELKAETIAWLEQGNVTYHGLFMRRHNDHRPDEVIKREIFERDIAPSYEVLFVLDDRARVVAMWRELGLICLQCDCGDF